jgi:two-component system phosphate regulon response regulator PhoB
VTKARVLLAEDNPALQNVIRFNLQSAGLDVVTVNRGDEAYQLFLKQHFDCVVLDHNMPGKTGVELVRTIRSGDHRSDIPIVLCTSRVNELDSDMLHNELRITAAIGKPFSVRQIVNVILQVTSKTSAPVPL